LFGAQKIHGFAIRAGRRLEKGYGNGPYQTICNPWNKEDYMDKQKIEAAREVVINYTVMAAATGACPVPTASVAVVAEDGIMISHVASVLDAKISVATVAQSVGAMSILNIVGRQLFIEIARLLSWGTGSWWAFAGLCACGAGTAGLQTYILGTIAIEIGKNDSQALVRDVARSIILQAIRDYKDNISAWKAKYKGIPKKQRACV